MVLLKNDGVLPLKKDAKVAFIGEFARTPRFQGGGSSNVNAYKVTSALEAAGTMGLQVSFAPGYAIQTAEPDEAMLREAAETAKNADVAVVFVGITDAMESEGFDRRTLSMPKTTRRSSKPSRRCRRIRWSSSCAAAASRCRGSTTCAACCMRTSAAKPSAPRRSTCCSATSIPPQAGGILRSGWRTTRPTSTTSATSRTAPNTARRVRRLPLLR